MKILGTICARGGSKGVPGKNIRPLAGQPLLAHTIAQARACAQIQRLIVSTDSPDIAAVARTYGAEVPFLRPADLASDAVAKLPVLQHALRFLQDRGEIYDLVVDLDPTSPLRTVGDIEAAIQHLLRRSDASNLFSVCPPHRNPYFNMIELDDQAYGHLVKSHRETFASRQTAPRVYDLNASIYVYRAGYLLSPLARVIGEHSIIYEMPEERSWDIDSLLDFAFVEFLMKERRDAAKA